MGFIENDQLPRDDLHIFNLRAGELVRADKHSTFLLKRMVIVLFAVSPFSSSFRESQTGHKTFQSVLGSMVF
jgi:hypothetical protein